MEAGGVQTDGVADESRGHHLRSKGLPGWRIHGSGDTLQEGQQVHLPQRDPAADDQNRQRGARQRQGPLTEQEQSPFGDAVGEGPGPRRGQGRQELQTGDQPQRHGGVVGEDGEHQPILSNPRHPGAGVGNQSTHPEQAVVAQSKRGEHGDPIYRSGPDCNRTQRISTRFNSSVAWRSSALSSALSPAN